MLISAIAHRHSRLIFVLLVACLASWVALWLGQSNQLALSHSALHSQATFSVQSLPSVAIGWALMTTAMMLPTSLPLILLFARLVGRGPHAPALIALLLAGYSLVWLSFGVLAQISYLLLQAIVHTWFRFDPWLVTALILSIAGAYQFSRLKYRCLDTCRSPFSFITTHWRGSNQHAQALRLGLAHGAFCVGCCWSLMLLMFVIGANGLGWMLAIGLVMAVEKNLPWGRRISRPLGLVLLGAAFGFALFAIEPISQAATTSMYWICTR